MYELKLCFFFCVFVQKSEPLKGLLRIFIPVFLTAVACAESHRHPFFTFISYRFFFFSGAIPGTLANATALERMLLQCNGLNGKMPRDPGAANVFSRGLWIG